MEEFFKQAKTWMSGQSDPAIRTAMNHALDQIGLQNQAAMDALQMQINQDPTLRGQGAGTALLAMMARDQNFKVDDIIANMSERNLERIVNMQKYGFEAGLKIEGIQFARREDMAQNLIAAGDYEGAARLLQQNLDSVVPGFGANITAESLKQRDPFEVKRVSDMLGLVRDLAKSDSAAATAILKSMIDSNPTLRSWLPAGITAEQMVSSFVTGESAANVQASNTLATGIRADIADGGEFAAVSSRLADLFKLQNRDATKEGEALSLERINEIRAADGLPPITDKNEFDDVDYEEFGYRNEFLKMQAKANEKPWQPLYDMIMQSPDAAKFLDPDLFPGGADAVKDFVINYSTGLVDFEWDPETQTLVPSASGFQKPWDNPDLFPMFFHMPLATFDANGNVVGEYSSGGATFSEDLPKTADEAELQERYSNYIRTTKTSGGKPLSAPQWYFATAGGTRQPDPTKIPSTVSQGTSIDPTKVGTEPEEYAFDSKAGTVVLDGKPVKLTDMTLLEWQKALTDPTDTVLNNLMKSGIVKEPSIPSMKTADGIDKAVRWMDANGFKDFTETKSPEGFPIFTFTKGSEPIIKSGDNVYRIVNIAKDRNGYAHFRVIDLRSGNNTVIDWIP